MSVRQSRDELIKRGVLKEIFEKGEPPSHSYSATPPGCRASELLKERATRADVVN